MRRDMLEVSRRPDGLPEIFHSLQGEGVFTGRPAVFLRLARCNLSCRWCDTRYTWDWERHDPREQVVKMTAAEVVSEVLLRKCDYLVVTGGEPLLQQLRLAPVLRQLKQSGLFVDIETNGTLLPAPVLVGLVDHWSVSPKLRNSGVPVSRRAVARCYGCFAASPACHFKFVLQDRRDWDEVSDLMRRYGLPADRVILMPEGCDRRGLLQRGRWVAEICRTHGCLFSTRLHVLLWGNERGR